MTKKDEKLEAKSDETTASAAAEEQDEDGCVWEMGTPCDDGEVVKQLMFNKQLKIPICDKHFEEHKEVMILHAKGHEIEEIVEMSAEDRKRLVLTMKLSGMDLGEVEV